MFAYKHKFPLYIDPLYCMRILLCYCPNYLGKVLNEWKLYKCEPTLSDKVDRLNEYLDNIKLFPLLTNSNKPCQNNNMIL